MRSPILALSLLLSLCACNPVPPLTNDEKAKFVYELIENYPNCDAYRKRLEVPAVESPAIDAVYREAIKTGCI
jgi:hypothetical protein